MKKRKQVLQYLCDLQKEMYLGHFQLMLSRAHADDDCHAQIFPTPGRFVATIKLGHDFYEMTPEDQRETLVHELLHLYLSVPDGIWGMNEALNETTYLVLREAMHMQIEYATDHIARVLSKFMSLPPS